MIRIYCSPNPLKGLQELAALVTMTRLTCNKNFLTLLGKKIQFYDFNMTWNCFKYCEKQMPRNSSEWTGHFSPCIWHLKCNLSHSWDPYILWGKEESWDRSPFRVRQWQWNVLLTAEMSTWCCLHIRKTTRFSIWSKIWWKIQHHCYLNKEIA